MKTQIIIIFSLLFYSGLHAQNATIVYAEWGGPGAFISANYDMRFSQKEDGLGGRIGLGVGGFSDPNGSLTIPVGINYLLGKDGKNYFEVGAGFTYMNVVNKAKSKTSVFNSSFGNLTFGYRLAPAKGGFLFKAQLTPLFNKYRFFPFYAGIAFGYKF